MAKGNDKSDWPLETLVTVMRNALRERGVKGDNGNEPKNNWGGTTGERANAAMKRNGGPAAPDFSPDLFDQVRLYPFTKGIDLTNDGVGYGEQTELKLRCATGKPETKLSRRTRTGNFCLHLPRASQSEPRTRTPDRSAVVPSEKGGGIAEDDYPGFSSQTGKV